MTTKGTLRVDLTFANVKDANNNILAAIWPGDSVYGELNTARTELNFSKIHRRIGHIQVMGQTCHCSVDKLNLYYNVDEPMEPAPEPAPAPSPAPAVSQVVSITFVDGLAKEIKVDGTEWKAAM